MPIDFVQTSLSQTARRLTLRGMHFQLPPSREGKLVQCVGGRIYDVAVDLRPQSASYLQYFGVELAADRPVGLFIPPGCAHGFLTLTDHCSIVYMMTDFYDPALYGGVRWNDPRLGIEWPHKPVEILERDAEFPDLDDAMTGRFAEY
jgi:dTDP-4-dehydrorhamnose 3,5-epimerase